MEVGFHPDDVVVVQRYHFVILVNAVENCYGEEKDKDNDGPATASSLRQERLFIV